MSSTQIAAPQAQGAGTLARQEFGAYELQQTAETAGAVLAAQSRAMVEARFVMAMRNRRDWDDVRTKMLKACERPGFAGSATETVWGAAWYRKPVGEGVEGFSIRFAEEAMRAVGNIDVQTVTVYDDATKRILTVTVTDLESNIAFQASLNIEKTVERKALRQGEQALRVRVGANNKPVYTVPATDDEVFTRQQNLASKAIRNAVLRLLPGDIQAECRSRIMQIRNGAAAKDPDGFRKELADSFARMNVLPSDLKKYLGHDLAQSTPAELTDLREVWKELQAGKTTWVEIMAELAAERGEDAPAAQAPPKPGLDGLTDKLKASSSSQTAAAQATTTPKPTATEPQPDPVTGEIPMTAEEIAKADAETAAQDAKAAEAAAAKAADAAAKKDTGRRPTAQPKLTE